MVSGGSGGQGGNSEFGEQGGSAELVGFLEVEDVGAGYDAYDPVGVDDWYVADVVFKEDFAEFTDGCIGGR